MRRLKKTILDKHFFLNKTILREDIDLWQVYLCGGVWVEEERRKASKKNYIPVVSR